MATTGTTCTLTPRPARALDLTGLPPLRTVPARDGSAIAFRHYPGGAGGPVVVLVHGTAVDSSVMHPLASRLQADGAEVLSLGVRGHGETGTRRGDLDRRGQLDDDLVDLLERALPPGGGTGTLVGFSGGGAFALRFAGGPDGHRFDRYLLLAPAFGPPSPVARRGTGGWACPRVGRIVALMALGRLGIHRFDGAEVLAFAGTTDRPEWTTRYSYRLTMDFGVRRPRAALRRCARPVAVVAGADDEQFHADRYGDELRPARPDVDIRLVAGLGHVDLITDPRGIDAISGALDLGGRAAI